jgi:DNA gyrase subunit B
MADSASPTVPVPTDYGAEHVQHLQNAAHIRHRPGMYIGNTSSGGLHHLVYELVYNSIDEALAGYCKQITVRLHPDGSCTVDDDGRGIPVEEHPEEKKPTLEVVMTMLGTSGKFDNKAYKVSAGLHGMGAKAVTALSEWTEARVRRNGRTYMQTYERGEAASEVQDIGAATHTGTSITFKPDPLIFHDATFSFQTLEERLRELAFLNKGISIHLIDERTNPPQEAHFQFQGGIAEFVEYMNQGEDVEHPPIYFQREIEVETGDGKTNIIKVEVAIQYTRGEAEQVRCYANNAFNPVGGTHLTGFRAALTRTIGNYAQKNNLIKEGLKLEGTDFREGLTAVISVQLPNPHFESQTKVRLNNPEVDSAVQTAVSQFLATYLEEHPKEAKRLVDRVVLAAEARIAARKAKELLKDRKNILNSGGLPGKLMDCTTRNRDESELFLVEGQSAGGSADNGRDREFQALLPLRGKVLNVEKAPVEKILANEEITSLIAAIGVDIGNVEDISRLRYGKIIILTDADVDGQHIRTLLLTFFFRQMRKLIEEGHIYVARPPLYCVTYQKKQVRYVHTVAEMHRELMERGLKDAKLLVYRNEGEVRREFVGEELRGLVELVGDLDNHLQIVERRGLNVNSLLASAGDRGLPMFHVALAGKEYWFHTATEVEEFRQAEARRRGRDLVVAEGGMSRSESSEANGSAPAEFFLQELHEMRVINRDLVRLHKEYGLEPADLIPAPRIAGREPPIRFVLQSGDQRRVLPHLRELVLEVRRLGERGITITRFKGLGEMDGEQLWETTMNPEKRTLMRVTLEDAVKAEQLFRILMGDKVEPRRDFITKHALEVKEIDYHGA